ncbi:MULTISPECIES: type II toxin-antitoxin system RelB/DinJ family antitoxin [Rahnella]|jgi:DNA-damage-inducible protein J|uniref:Type II toxin-antitoxin system antitoxin, RelB/DinJ family n=1 Tax=Rahnella variigena TaxID=574964 RepID=A0ABX9Q020_9GAMM|nr:MULTISPECIES: type II toxin-antitoxin system RelB/DinJ family antitoxin [Rahnella]MDH2896855.1 type II toxin-antitoxin system RelB/DinJ family antitoxin [Rahnella variigena]RBQ34041.1 type II toxin-antitoxin system antitoxin, RelB/DinJ family [Rahnella aquatilis]RJT51585.1 type II toxin-antitoxin system RelB/DinJ family antitoxin [Rahnella variigena]RKF70661.1 type II toxin-antitoxin system antitoxin, RelB/DinJ family [Rahnella variigena]TCQ83503.1 DNA-damage-inducible protein J [Rahnella s
MTDTVVRARVTSASKAAAMANAKAMGLDLSTIIRMVVNRLAVNAELPVELLQPNAKTLQAIRDMENGIGVERVATIEELKHDLGW